MTKNKYLSFDNLTGSLPVVEIEAGVSNTGPPAGGGVLRVSQGGGRGHGGEDDLVRVKVDPDLEGGGVAAGGGVGSGGRGGGPEVAADSRHPVDVSRGGRGVLESSDLEIVTIGDLAALGGAEGGDAGAHGADRGGLGGVQGGAAHPVRGLGGGRGDVGAVADVAVAPGPPQADVVILVTQMGLRTGDGRGGRVPVKAGDCA